MGGFFHFFYFNQGSMARKILAHKRHVDGLEAPRNSLELQVEPSQCCCPTGDGLVEKDWSEKNCYPIEASMKRLINEEIAKQSNTRKNAPSIVARLMGVDMLPIDTKSLVQPVHKKIGNMGTKYLKKEKNERSWVSHLSSNSISSRQMEFDSLYHIRERDAVRWGNGQKLGKPRPREHPQEEELQKFKKEFEAWQAARFKECSKVVEIDNNSSPFLAQDNVKQQKMVLNTCSEMSTSEKPVDCKGHALKARSCERASLHHRHKLELFPAHQKEFFSSGNRSRNNEHSTIHHDQKPDKSSSPTRIVILKPGPDRFCDPEECWTSSSGTLEDRGSIEGFLEEVKEQLKYELQGKTHKKDYIERGSGIETAFSAKPSDRKLIARNIAKHVRDSVTRDLGMNLLHSESTRSYRSEIQFNAAGSPEFINRDTGRFSSERLRNVLKKEIHSVDVSRSSFLDNENTRLKQLGDSSQSRHLRNYWEIAKDEQEMQTRSFRHGSDDMLLHRELSPWHLVRSLSAPVSGTSFGKLLLEDRHVLTGAHIRRKHEALENVAMELKKRKKERFNIKEKVSNLRYNFTLRGRLLGKKLQSMVESHGSEQDFVKDIMSGPTVVRNFGERHVMENSTEVPPSPASACSNPQEEFWWRPVDYLSPVSTSNVSPGDDSAMPQVFREISSDLNELRRQLNQLESIEPDDSIIEQEPSECILVDLEDTAEAYIRDLLVASGFYDGSCNKCLSRWDPLAKPISNSVFEKVEESCGKLAKDNESTTKDHKMLFDLLNEALSILLGPPVTMSRYQRKIINSSLVAPLHGRKLLDFVWDIIRVYLYPPDNKSYYSLDSLLARCLESSPWSGLIEDDLNALGKEMECMITGDIIEEIVKDLHF